MTNDDRPPGTEGFSQGEAHRYVDERSPDEVFALLGNETRMAIVRGIWEADEEEISFSTLYDRVDVGDSGQFNYHLTKLLDHFVEKTDDGYRLREAGRQVVAAVMVGAIHTDPSAEFHDLSTACFYCGGTLTMAYADGYVVVRCTDCHGSFSAGEGEAESDRVDAVDAPIAHEDADAAVETDAVEDADAAVETDAIANNLITRVHLPPAGLRRRTPDEIVDAAWTWQSSQLLAMNNGVCPTCSGAVDRSLEICTEHETSEDGLCRHCGSRYQTLVTYACSVCSKTMTTTVFSAVSIEPPILEFGRAHGIEPLRPRWDDATRVDDFSERVVSTNPVRIRLEMTIDDDSLTTTVDESLQTIGDS